MKTYNYSLTELDMMIPWEREVYMTLLIERIKEENEHAKQQNNR